MIDIAVGLESFISLQRDWSRERSVLVAAAIAAKLRAPLAWDKDAGEDWSRVLLKMNAGVMIYMAGPLIVTSADVAPQISAIAGDFSIITVPSLDAVVLTADAQILHAAFGDEVWDNPALDPAHFSADELWFCTI
jgi:hypothetical protein